MVKIGKINLGEKPVLLAPMEDVTDPSFRHICKQQGADMVYTEFISCEGLIRDAHKSVKKLDIFDVERPVGIQLFGHVAESMARAAKIATEATPDLIDINFGCPVAKVTGKGGGAALLQHIDKMVEITTAVVKSTTIPVTAKARLGWDDKTKNIVEIAERLQDVGIQAITIHGRTRAQLYKGEADWTLIAEVKNNPRITIPVIGNGDITCAKKAHEYFNRFGIDGIMVGRAAVGNPWLFKEIKHFLNTGEQLERPSISERVDVCLQHLEKSLLSKGEYYGLIEMRRHFTLYFKSIPNFKSVRLRLLTCNNISEVRAMIEEIRIM